jgi:hypothetical protein
VTAINPVKSNFGVDMAIRSITEYKAFETSQGNCKEKHRK